ncbi:MAG: alkaline phosphatase family protein [Candidatus Delongbacteria bacterium]|jgi:predicted AlkP superfamily pyrophosphatase or phosphodiesterase|nr:alkaline phosphatase family protein [Candidatus Delongbacteria bacterium]
MKNKPDYDGGSIVNLMSTISGCFNVDSKYSELKDLSSNDLKKYDNIVTLVIDGLGYNFVNKTKDNLIKDNVISKITSVFPTTTAACITSFATGLAPMNHGITGWFMKVKKDRKVFPSTILLFNNRRTGKQLTDYGIMPKDIFIDNRLSKGIKDITVIHPEATNNSTYSNYMLDGAKKLNYKDLQDYFLVTAQAVKKKCITQKYIYSYLPDFDGVFHELGGKSKEIKELYSKINSELKKFLKNIKGTNTLVLITADHGLKDNSPASRFKMNDYPQIVDLLNFPLCGEPRAAYCYVKRGMNDKFEKVVKEQLSHAFYLKRSKDMIKDEYFGLYEPTPQFKHRVGDYILLAKKNYVIKDFLPREEVKYHMADHGGLSEDELFVPLCKFEVK